MSTIMTKEGALEKTATGLRNLSQEPKQLREAPRCQVMCKSTGKRCRAPAVRGKTVCHKHGGAKGSGGPRGEANGAYIHGGETQEAHRLRASARHLLKELRDAA